MNRFLVALGMLVACTLGCDDGPESHVYVAMVYEPARDCLDPSTSVAIVATPAGSLECAPTCLVLPAPPATPVEKVYVSTMCGPYPADLDTRQTSETCPAALAAFARGPDTCLAGGGSTDPQQGGGVGGGGADAGSAEDGGDDDGGATDAPTG